MLNYKLFFLAQMCGIVPEATVVDFITVFNNEAIEASENLTDEQAKEKYNTDKYIKLIEDREGCKVQL